MIFGTCYTNLDDFKQIQWPSFFGAVPRVGERVMSLGGTEKLQVYSITHTLDKNGKPFILIELDKHK